MILYELLCHGGAKERERQVGFVIFTCPRRPKAKRKRHRIGIWEIERRETVTTELFLRSSSGAGEKDVPAHRAEGQTLFDMAMGRRDLYHGAVVITTATPTGAPTACLFEEAVEFNLWIWDAHKLCREQNRAPERQGRETPTEHLAVSRKRQGSQREFS